tara:strand:+ start:25 stop:207 length:183 start_codon:yes stop_codon:yes gene_type:complete
MKFRIGDRVKVIDQDITGTVIKYSNGNKLIILDDDDSWQDENHLATLEYRESDLIYEKQI